MVPHKCRNSRKVCWRTARDALHRQRETALAQLPVGFALSMRGQLFSLVEGGMLTLSKHRESERFRVRQ
jgi:hypothetical protein